MFKNELCYFQNRPAGPSYGPWGALVPAGTVLVTPDLNNAPACTYYVITTLWNSVYLHSVVSSQGLGIGEKA